MNVAGLVLAQGPASPAGSGALSFAARLGGRSLLERAVETLAATPEVDAVHVLTDDPALAAAGRVGPARTALAPDWFWTCGLAFFSKEHWLLARALDALGGLGITADVLFVLTWRTPLLTARSLERMYHRLLEDRVAARVAGINPVDPNLYIRLRESAFFPVWGDLGADRQKIPQLYRFAQAGVLRPDRLLRPMPETAGFELPDGEDLVLTHDEDLDLAAFYLARANRAAAPGRP